MAQNNVDFSDNPTGAELMDDYLDKQKENILTSNSGVQRPSYAVAGTVWINNSVTPWSMYIFDGADDILQGYIDPTNNKYIPVTPMTDTGDMIVQGVDDNPARLAAGAVDTVLTSNGVGQLPSYKVNPLGVLKYLPTYTYKENDVVVNVDEEGNIALFKSLVNDNTGNPLTDMTYWEEISLGGGGGGLEIGDIGIAPFGIDESQNKRRYLNGQVISQAQFPGFTAKLKKAVQLYPNLATSEAEWQTEQSGSANKQCGRFVIDDNAGTIRLPKVKDISSTVDLSKIALRTPQSAPNITGEVSRFSAGGGGYMPLASGAFSVKEIGNGYQGGSAGINEKIFSASFNASKVLSTYGRNGNILHQEAVQYPYFIQVATGVEESIDVSKEIQLNNPFSLLDYKWSEYEITNASWLISNGSFHSGATYPAVYELLTKIQNGTESKAGVSVKLSTEAYTDTDFVLNTADTTFRLPIKVKLASGNAVVGNGMTLGLTNGNELFGLYTSLNDSIQIGGQAGIGKNVGYTERGLTTSANRYAGVTTDPSKSGIETSSQGIYLYFYVGETIQDANIINAAGVLTRVATLSDEYIVGLGMPDYSAGVVTSSGYVADRDYIVVCIPIAPTTGRFVIKVDNKIVFESYQSTAYQEYTSGNFFLPKGKTLLVEEGAFVEISRFPLKGVN